MFPISALWHFFGVGYLHKKCACVATSTKLPCAVDVSMTLANALNASSTENIVREMRGL